MKRFGAYLVLPVSLFIACLGMVSLAFFSRDAFFVSMGLLGGCGSLISVMEWRRRNLPLVRRLPPSVAALGRAAFSASLSAGAVVALLLGIVSRLDGTGHTSSLPFLGVFVLLVTADALLVGRYAFGVGWFGAWIGAVLHPVAIIFLIQLLFLSPWYVQVLVGSLGLYVYRSEFSMNDP